MRAPRHDRPIPLEAGLYLCANRHVRSRRARGDGVERALSNSRDDTLLDDLRSVAQVEPEVCLGLNKRGRGGVRERHLRLESFAEPVSGKETVVFAIGDTFIHMLGGVAVGLAGGLGVGSALRAVTRAAIRLDCLELDAVIGRGGGLEIVAHRERLARALVDAVATVGLARLAGGAATKLGYGEGEGRGC